MAAEPVSPEVAPTIVTRSDLGEDVVEEPPDKLQGDVLEGERRAVEQLEQPLVVAELDERAHRRVGEAGVGVGDHRDTGTSHATAPST